MRKVFVNGEYRELADGATVRDRGARARAWTGAAPRSRSTARWSRAASGPQTELRDGQEIEVLHAVQGGSPEAFEIAGRSLALAPDPRHGRLPQPRRRWPRRRARRARSWRPSRCAGSTRRARGSILDVLARGRPRGAAQHGRLLHRPRGGHHRAAGARGARDRLGQARGDRRRPHAAARPGRAARGGRDARRPTASSCCPTRTTTRSSPAGSRTPAAPRSCRSARRSAAAWGSTTRTTCA